MLVEQQAVIDNNNFRSTHVTLTFEERLDVHHLQIGAAVLAC